jgi:ABC-type amino acid transport substrate-binding protein
MLVPQGLFGFEGLLLYRDFRAGWLAGVIKTLCHFLLREMGKPSSPVYWAGESAGNEPYRAANDLLVEMFERLLGFAEKFERLPDANWTERLAAGLVDELCNTFTKSPQKSYPIRDDG